jgi:DNA-binding ferritin-like protein
MNKASESIRWWLKHFYEDGRIDEEFIEKLCETLDSLDERIVKLEKRPVSELR